MATAKGKDLFQYCILENYVTEVLALPKSVCIEQITFSIGFSLKGIVTNVPKELAQLGVTYLREPTASMEAQGILVGTRKEMYTNAVEICKRLSLDVRHMRVKRLVISYKGNKFSFVRMTKIMAGDDNNTQRIKVLGLTVTKATDKEINAVVKELNAKKVQCRYDVKTVQTVLCTM